MYRIMIFLDLCVSCLILLFENSSGLYSNYTACVPRSCENGQIIKFPFYISNVQETFCGLFGIDCSNFSGFPIYRMSDNDYVIQEISYENHSFRVYNSAVDNFAQNCFSEFRNASPPSPSMSIPSQSRLHLLSRCNNNGSVSEQQLRKYQVGCNNETGDGFELAMHESDENLSSAIQECDMNVAAPVDLAAGDEGRRNGAAVDYKGMLRRGFALNWTTRNSSSCELSGGRCGINVDTNGVMCFCPYGAEYVLCKPRNRRNKLKIILATAISGGLLLVIAFAIFLVRKKGLKDHFHFLARSISKTSSKRDFEGGSVYFGLPVFSYAELEEVTNSFDASKELGDGGFGTVYYGKLRDGREVAVKRLYENNFKRMAQFMNEVEILTRLRHPNLVSLYGCTSRKSRELLLVYEYIPNGTVADHLHGNRAEDQLLTWPVRLNIAIETANALAYLHASDIIHRDVKTNNILLDQNFQVKVGDFGLSRLLPNDVSHVSTAPQGTPGYVDPEYHQCYQLTDKSDVYSFGVVLIELISSMPAVDISRHRNEINLANLAVNKIQRQAFNELIDPSLGYELDPEVMRMTTSVAELAFRCLQLEKEMRPAMDEVLETLTAIQDWNNKKNSSEKTNEAIENTSESSGRTIHASPESDDVVLLEKNKRFPFSPNAVTDLWGSGSTTTTTSSR